ncbi:hypothetical protein [Actinomadura sp. DC4]|nr:hypothetical protein [Actinomadura sp. DC4]MDN3356071.1 hypothetical protein [Actinomadura sp. DC4]
MSAIDGEAACAWIEEHVADVRLTPWQRELLGCWFGLRKVTAGGGPR